MILCRLQHELEVQAEQGERQRQAEVAAAETAGQAAIAAAADAHDVATMAAQNRFNASIATLKAQLVSSQETAKALQATCTEVETRRQGLASQCGHLKEEVQTQRRQHAVRRHAVCMSGSADALEDAITSTIDSSKCIARA